MTERALKGDVVSSRDFPPAIRLAANAEVFD
jgi:hypothetical protein